MRGSLFVIQACIIFSCNYKPENVLQTSFPTAETAFKYYIDTTGLIKDKKDSRRYVSGTVVKDNVKRICSNSYEVYFKNDGKLYKKPTDIIIELFNNDGQITRRYLKFYEIKEINYTKGNKKVNSFIPYEKNIIHLFKYNQQKQLVRFYILLDESSKDDKKSELVGLSEIIYFKSFNMKDSVLINNYGFSNNDDNGAQMFGYNLKKNKIESYYRSFFYYSQLLGYAKSLYLVEKNKGVYIENYAVY
jgi:hypothetical protein